MKRHLPVIVLCFAFCVVFVARNWFTFLLADEFVSLGLPLGIVIGSVSLLAGLIVLARMPASQRRAERLKTTLLLICLVVITIAFDITYARGLPTGSFATAFNSEQWKREGATRRDIADQQKMVGDLVRTILPSADREAVVRMLGSSENTGYSHVIAADLLYRLGAKREFTGVDSDSEWLAIWFDRNSRVARCEILCD